jgi:undecaprenyl-phosphate galactose phosphotransferase
MASKENAVAATEGRGRLRVSDTYLNRYRHWVTVFILAFADILAFTVSFFLFCWHREVPQLVYSTGGAVGQTPLDVFLILGMFFVIVRYICGDYGRRQLFWDSTRTTSVALIVTSIPSLIILAFAAGRFSTVAVVCSWVFLLFAIPSFRQLARLGMHYAGIWDIPTTLVVCGTRAAAVYKALSNTLSLGYDVRSLVIDGHEKDLPPDLMHLKCSYLTEPGDIVEKVQRSGCDNVVISIDDMQSPNFAHLIKRLMEADIAVSFVPSFLRLPLVRVSTGYFFGRDVLLFQVSNNLRRRPFRVMKRAFDIVGALVLLLLFSPFFILIAIAIKRHDGGPVIYRQKRTGRHGEPFFCLKFRTMASDADERLNCWKTENPEIYAEFLRTYKLLDDPRITGPGKWLRRTSLDELPQIVNVLRGEMSLVGPRPIPEQQLREQYGPGAYLYKTVRPGLTGLWQVSGRNDTSLEERVNYDEWYILNWSFWYDVVILLQTSWIVLTGRGAY